MSSAENAQMADGGPKNKRSRTPMNDEEKTIAEELKSKNQELLREYVDTYTPLFIVYSDITLHIIRYERYKQDLHINEVCMTNETEHSIVYRLLDEKNYPYIQIVNFNSFYENIESFVDEEENEVSTAIRDYSCEIIHESYTMGSGGTGSGSGSASAQAEIKIQDLDEKMTQGGNELVHTDPIKQLIEKNLSEKYTELITYLNKYEILNLNNKIFYKLDIVEKFKEIVTLLRQPEESTQLVRFPENLTKTQKIKYFIVEYLYNKRNTKLKSKIQELITRKKTFIRNNDPLIPTNIYKYSTFLAGEFDSFQFVVLKKNQRNGRVCIGIQKYKDRELNLYVYEFNRALELYPDRVRTLLRDLARTPFSISSYLHKTQLFYIPIQYVKGKINANAINFFSRGIWTPSEGVYMDTCGVAQEDWQTISFPLFYSYDLECSRPTLQNENIETIVENQTTVQYLLGSNKYVPLEGEGGRGGEGAYNMSKLRKEIFDLSDDTKTSAFIENISLKNEFDLFKKYIFTEISKYELLLSKNTEDLELKDFQYLFNLLHSYEKEFDLTHPGRPALLSGISNSLNELFMDDTRVQNAQVGSIDETKIELYNTTYSTYGFIELLYILNYLNTKDVNKSKRNLYAILQRLNIEYNAKDSILDVIHKINLVEFNFKYIPLYKLKKLLTTIKFAIEDILIKQIPPYTKQVYRQLQTRVLQYLETVNNTFILNSYELLKFSLNVYQYLVKNNYISSSITQKSRIMYNNEQLNDNSILESFADYQSIFIKEQTDILYDYFSFLLDTEYENEIGISQEDIQITMKYLSENPELALENQKEYFEKLIELIEIWKTDKRDHSTRRSSFLLSTYSTLMKQVKKLQSELFASKIWPDLEKQIDLFLLYTIL